MKHSMQQRVYYADTDSYGVVWHGTYLRWMESARIEFCTQIGIDLIELANKDIVIPVTNINIRYKASAKLDDRIIIETYISKITPLTVTFIQTIKNLQTQQIYANAEVETVAIHNNGKLYRKLPEELKIKLEESLECKD